MQLAAGRDIGHEVVALFDPGGRRVHGRRREADLFVALHDGEKDGARIHAQRGLGETLGVRAEVLAPHQHAQPSHPHRDNGDGRERPALHVDFAPAPGNRLRNTCSSNAVSAMMTIEDG